MYKLNVRLGSPSSVAVRTRYGRVTLSFSTVAETFELRVPSERNGIVWTPASKPSASNAFGNDQLFSWGFFVANFRRTKWRTVGINHRRRACKVPGAARASYLHSRHAALIMYSINFKRIEMNSNCRLILNGVG